MNLLTQMKRAVVFVLALVGAGAIIRWVVPHSGDSGMPEGASVVGTYPSPDNKHRAIIVEEDGGGGISPYCIVTVGVMSSTAPTASAWRTAERVLVTGCDGVLFGKWDEEVHWKSADHLEIALDPSEGARDVSELTARGYADSGRVAISYVQPALAERGGK